MGTLRAARALGISGSLVSRHVAELERDLGVRLVNRTARTVSLTEAGTHYAEFAARIIDEIDRAETLLRGLRDKYAQYRTMALEPEKNPIVRSEPDRVHAWGARFGPPARS